MKKNIALVISWWITLTAVVVLIWLWQGFNKQNHSQRNLRVGLWQQQVTMRESQVEIAKQLDSVDPATREKIMTLLVESANEVDAMRFRNGFDMGGSQLEKLMQELEQAGDR